MVGLLYDRFPPVEFLFEDDRRLLDAVTEQFTSSIPLAMLSEAALMKYKGIGRKYARDIHARLREAQIDPARYVETQYDTVQRLFGCIEDAPMHALDVTGPLSSSLSNRHEPLGLLITMDQIIPEMIVMNLVEYNHVELHEYIITMTRGDMDGETVDDQIAALNARLNTWGLRLAESTSLYLLTHQS